MSIGLGLIIVICVFAILVHPALPVRRALARRSAHRERAFWEDVLRQTLQMEQDGRPANAESLAGATGRKVTELRHVLARMQERGLLEGTAQSVQLSSQGTQWAMHVLRAHRLWESYLADEAGLPMARLHTQAERQEHHLSSAELDAIDAHLGHPAEDPHGDPIPTAEGELAQPRGTSLAQWDGSAFVRVVHVEDEPQELFNRLVAKRIVPGAHLQLIPGEGPAVDVQMASQTISLEHELLANVEVEEDHQALAGSTDLQPLSALPTGTLAEVVHIGSAIRGFSRRRLLDFGITPGTRIRAILDNPFGDPRAFSVRGTTIAIRGEQASLIWVRRCAAEAEPRKDVA